MSSSTGRITSASLRGECVERQPVPRKPVQHEQNIFHNRPAKYILRESGGKLLREWKSGAYIRELSWKHRVRARDIEDLLRREIA